MSPGRNRSYHTLLVLPMNGATGCSTRPIQPATDIWFCFFSSNQHLTSHACLHFFVSCYRFLIQGTNFDLLVAQYLPAQLANIWQFQRKLFLEPTVSERSSHFVLGKILQSTALPEYKCIVSQDCLDYELVLCCKKKSSSSSMTLI
jgi:hypothetical protein